MEPEIYTVSEITSYIEALLSADERLEDLWITGEISNYYHHNSGHMYFSIKDGRAKIDAVMFKSRNRRLKFQPEDGLEVNAHGYIGIYAPRGSYQLYVDSMEPVGEGSLYLAFKQLKEKLEAEGLFAEEKKKVIPALPARIGIVTSPDGAAIRDILSVVKRRFRNVSVLIVPTLVQGDQAAEQIAAGISYLNHRDDIDLIIISRGGGSIEDLWPFNEEVVARTIYDSKIPIISGVGHETDFTIADFVADLRAPTPSAAAEMAVASRLELERDLEHNKKRLVNLINSTLKNNRQRLKSLAGRRVFRDPSSLLADDVQKLDNLNRRLQWSMDKKLSATRQKFGVLAGKLDTLSPLKTLERGYSITKGTDDRVITGRAQVEPGDDLLTRITDGIIYSRVQDIRGVDEKDG